MSWRDLPHAPAPGTPLCRFDAIGDGEAKMLELGEGDAVFRLLLLRSGEELFAYANRCAHFGAPLAARPEQLLYVPHQSISCNIHYARYSWHDGRCLGGECAGDSLQTIPVARQGDLIVIAPSE